MARSCHDDPIADSNALQEYAVRSPLGAGTFGTVSEAVDPHGRRVALKELRSSLVADAEAQRRFATVAPLLTSIDHPHVVRLLEWFAGDGRYALASELIGGGTLRQRAQAGVSPEVACALTLAVASGVERAGRAGVMHRDLKPENVLLTSTGVAKVSDFGLVEIVSGARTLATRDGTVVGAPAYMAPELVRSEDPSPASDVYALATILYELLAGRLPFPDDGGGPAIMARHVQDAPTALLTVASGVAPPIAGVTMRGLADDAAARYASADEFGAALADAAAQAWGAGWLRTTGITVTASEAITDRLRATRALEVPVATETLAPPTRAPSAGETIAAATAGETIAAPAAAPSPTVYRPAAPPTAPAPAAAPQRKRRGGVIAAAVVVVLLVAGGLVFFLTRDTGGGPTTIGPKTVSVDSRQPWTDTAIVLKQDDDVAITASGNIFPDSPKHRELVAGPDGAPGHPELLQFNVVPTPQHGGLIGRVGTDGAPFNVGSSDHFIADGPGHLFLGINDTGLFNNDGAFVAKVTVTRK